MPGGHKWVDDRPEVDGEFGGYAFGSGLSSPGSETAPSLTRKKKNSLSSQLSPSAWGRKKTADSYFPTVDDEDDRPPSRTAYRPAAKTANLIDDGSTLTGFETHFESDFNKPASRPTHRPQLSLRTPTTAHVPSFNPDSPFNDLPPFPSAAKNGYGHGRSMSSAPYVPPGRANMFSPSISADPFSTSIEEDDFERPRRTSSSANADASQKPRLTPKAGLQAPLSVHDGVGRAIALFDFKAVEVRRYSSLCKT